MKQFWTRILFLILLVGTTASFTACSDNDKVPGGGDKPGNAEVFPGANAIYLGDDSEPGMGHYCLTLYSEGLIFDEDSWAFDGKGEFIWLDLSAAMAEDLKNVRLVPGTYAAADFETYKEFTFQRGEKEQEMGSFAATSDGGNESLDMILDGELKIENKGSGYAIQVAMKTESGLEKTLKFEGDIPMQLFGVAPGPDPFAGIFVNSGATYFGNYYDAGMGNIELMLTDMERDAEGLVYPGHQLYLDVNTSIFTSQADIMLAPGTYACDASQTYNTPLTFNAGYDGEDGLYGSVWVECDADGNEESYAVTSGRFTVTKNDSDYTVLVSVGLDNGENRAGEYVGSLRVEDGTVLSRMTGDVAPVCTKGRMIFNGDIQYYQENAYNWTIWLATNGIDFNNPGNPANVGEMIQLDINTTKDSTTEIPSGAYAVIERISNEYLVPFTYIPGFIDLNRGLLGSWYIKNSIALGPAVAGTLTIENKGGGIYVFEYDFEDDYYYAPRPHKITGRYEGTLSYVDASVLPEALAKPKSVGSKQPLKFKAEKSSAHKLRRIVRR